MPLSARPPPYPPTSPPLRSGDPRSPLRPFFPPHHARPPAQTPSARPPPLPPRCRPMQSPTPITSQYGAAPLPPRSPRTRHPAISPQTPSQCPPRPAHHTTIAFQPPPQRRTRSNAQDPMLGKHSNAASLPNAADYHALYHWSSTILRPLNEACNTKPPLCRRVPGRPPRPRPPSLAVAPTHARAGTTAAFHTHDGVRTSPTPFPPSDSSTIPLARNHPSHPGPRHMHGMLTSVPVRSVRSKSSSSFFSCASPSRCSSS